MVRKKSTGGCHGRSPTCKMKKDGSQVTCNKDLASLADMVNSDISAASPELTQTADQGQLGFPDRVYLLASVIFQNNHLEKPAAHRLVSYGKERGLPLPEVRDEEMQRAAYELAFSALKYQEVLEDIMIDSCFYLTQPTPDEQMSLVAVMLCDFQDRKFFPRERRGREIIQEVRDVENYLHRFKTKLAASLARCRIKHDLLSIECILPEIVKMKQERSSSLPLYAWVNTLKSSLDEVLHVLESAGFSQVKSIGQLEGQTFCQDPHCKDVLVFPAQLKAQLYSTKLLSDHKLIIQDKSCCLGPNAVCSLLLEEEDVLMVGVFSGITVSHTASLIADKHKTKDNGQPTVYVCVGDRTAAQRKELQQTVTSMGCNNVKMIPEDFQSLDGGDKRLLRVRIVLLTPKCSVSAVSNPVEYILQENGDSDLLQDLSQGSIAQSKLEALVAQQRKDIDHALKFPKVLAVVYSTCSSYPEENQKVVSRALEQAKARSEQEGEPKQANFRLSPHPFSGPNDAEGSEDTEPFFMLESSDESNGCFLAVLNREPEPVVKEAPHEVIHRANAKGILDKIGSNNQLTRKEQRGHNRKMAKTTLARNSHPSLTLSIQSRNQETKGSNSTTLCGRQEFVNKRQSPQVKPKALHSQASKNTLCSPVSSSKQDRPSPSKPENGAIKTSIPPVLHLTTAASQQHPGVPPAALRAPVVRPRRPRQEVLRPVVLVLPPLGFPSFFPPPHCQAGYSHSLNYNRWRSPSHAAPPSHPHLSRDTQMVKSQPQF